MAAAPLKIGILNLMHDKQDTQQRFTHVLTATGYPVHITYLYPPMHYAGRPVPPTVAKISQPLVIPEVKQLDAFIITGAPIEQLPFNQVTYIDEIHHLIDELVKQRIPQLYICWGAMVAANYLYGIEKHLLPEKLFGVYSHQVLNDRGLLRGFPNGFSAPHGRYAELDQHQIEANPNLILESTTVGNHLFSFRARSGQQNFLFAHLEYGRDALLKEYHREKNAYPDREYAKPQHYFADPVHMQDPQFKWQLAQKLYFRNWLQSVAQNVTDEQLIKE